MRPNLGHGRLIGTAGHTHPARQAPKFIDCVKTSPDLPGLFGFQVHESGKDDKFGIARTQGGDNLLEWQIQNALLFVSIYDMLDVGRGIAKGRKKRE